MNTTNNKQNDIASILEALSPENRGIIEERLVTMSKAAFLSLGEARSPRGTGMCIPVCIVSISIASC